MRRIYYPHVAQQELQQNSSHLYLNFMFPTNDNIPPKMKNKFYIVMRKPEPPLFHLNLHKILRYMKFAYRLSKPSDLYIYL